VWLNKLPSVSCQQVKQCLVRLGFEKRKQKSGTSHEHYCLIIHGEIAKVTVDCPKAPFSSILMKSMAAQAKFPNYRTFVAYCCDKKFKSEPHPLLK
jgi:predicted RNA binding protein YcfA (HicA-like mRNA interferase family)